MSYPGLISTGSLGLLSTTGGHVTLLGSSALIKKIISVTLAKLLPEFWTINIMRAAGNSSVGSIKMSPRMAIKGRWEAMNSSRAKLMLSRVNRPCQIADPHNVAVKKATIAPE